MNYPRNLMKYLGEGGGGWQVNIIPRVLLHSTSCTFLNWERLTYALVRILAVDLDPILERGGGYIDSLGAIGLIAG